VTMSDHKKQIATLRKEATNARRRIKTLEEQRDGAELSMKLTAEGASKLLKEKQANNTKLREYVQHKITCKYLEPSRVGEDKPCNCGFDALFTEPTKTPSSEEEK